MTTHLDEDERAGTVTFGNASAGHHGDVLRVGSYTLRLTASDSALSAQRRRRGHGQRRGANQAPVVNAGADQTITLPATASLSGTVTDDGKPTRRPR